MVTMISIERSHKYALSLYLYLFVTLVSFTHTLLHTEHSDK